MPDKPKENTLLLYQNMLFTLLKRHLRSYFTTDAKLFSCKKEIIFTKINIYVHEEKYLFS